MHSESFTNNNRKSVNREKMYRYKWIDADSITFENSLYDFYFLYQLNEIMLLNNVIAEND